jgi:hypothetical protein
MSAAVVVTTTSATETTTSAAQVDEEQASTAMEYVVVAMIAQQLESAMVWRRKALTWNEARMRQKEQRQEQQKQQHHHMLLSRELPPLLAIRPKHLQQEQHSRAALLQRLVPLLSEIDARVDIDFNDGQKEEDVDMTMIRKPEGNNGKGRQGVVPGSDDGQHQDPNEDVPARVPVKRKGSKKEQELFEKLRMKQAHLGFMSGQRVGAATSAHSSAAAGKPAVDVLNHGSEVQIRCKAGTGTTVVVGTASPASTATSSPVIQLLTLKSAAVVKFRLVGKQKKADSARGSSSLSLTLENDSELNELKGRMADILEEINRQVRTHREGSATDKPVSRIDELDGLTRRMAARRAYLRTLQEGCVHYVGMCDVATPLAAPPPMLPSWGAQSDRLTIACNPESVEHWLTRPTVHKHCWAFEGGGMLCNDGNSVAHHHEPFGVGDEITLQFTPSPPEVSTTSRGKLDCWVNGHKQKSVNIRRCSSDKVLCFCVGSSVGINMRASSASYNSPSATWRLASSFISEVIPRTMDEMKRLRGGDAASAALLARPTHLAVNRSPTADVTSVATTDTGSSTAGITPATHCNKKDPGVIAQAVSILANAATWQIPVVAAPALNRAVTILLRSRKALTKAAAVAAAAPPTTTPLSGLSSTAAAPATSTPSTSTPAPTIPSLVQALLLTDISVDDIIGDTADIRDTTGLGDVGAASDAADGLVGMSAVEMDRVASSVRFLVKAGLDLGVPPMVGDDDHNYSLQQQQQQRWMATDTAQINPLARAVAFALSTVSPPHIRDFLVSDMRQEQLKRMQELIKTQKLEAKRLRRQERDARKVFATAAVVANVATAEGTAAATPPHAPNVNAGAYTRIFVHSV